MKLPTVLFCIIIGAVLALHTAHAENEIVDKMRNLAEVHCRKDCPDFSEAPCSIFGDLDQCIGSLKEIFEGNFERCNLSCNFYRGQLTFGQVCSRFCIDKIVDAYSRVPAHEILVKRNMYTFKRNDI